MQILKNAGMDASSKNSSFMQKMNFLKMFERKTGKANHSSGRARKILSKLSGAFILPIVVMSIAGLFLGIGAAIASNTTGDAQTFGKFIQNIGEPTFAALPLLFAAGFVISFTDEAGAAVFAVIIAYLVFASLQQGLIFPVTNDKNEIVGFDVLWRNGASSGRDPIELRPLVGTTLGFRSLQTSVFGGIVVGLVVAKLYNKYKEIKFWAVFNFFGGKRFIPLISAVAMIPVSVLFLIFWPWVGQGLASFGIALGKAKYGDSFVFGFIERSLVPFGLHHVFYSPLWYSQVGGDVSASFEQWVQAGNTLLDSSNNPITTVSANESDVVRAWVSALRNKGSEWQGDSTISLKIVGLGFNELSFRLKDSNVTQTLPVYDFLADQLNIRVARFLQGKFVFMHWGLPLAAFAMVLAAPKENRKLAISACVPAGFTCLLTGITEPIEFTFLFLSPLLFWGFHAFMCAVAFFLMNLVNAHIAQSFSGGLIDWIIYGVVPLQKGTRFYYSIVFGLGYAPIYFFVFYFWIRIRDLATPGRGESVSLFTKKDYLQRKDAKSINPQAMAIINSFGGFDNIVVYENCASRLRYDVKDTSKVDIKKLKASGAYGAQIIGKNHVQAVFGPNSVPINNNIKALAEEYKKDPSKFANYKDTGWTATQAKPAESAKVASGVSVPVLSPVQGQVRRIEELKDGVFSAKMMGDGFMIDPEVPLGQKAQVYAPISGKLITVMPHAYGIRDKNGLEVLVHLGLETVALKDKGFATKVSQDQEVKAGQLLGTYDYHEVKKKVPSAAVILIVLNDGKLTNVQKPKYAKVRVGETIANVS